MSLGCGFYPAILVRTQGVARIRKQSSYPDGAGPDVNLAVREIEPAFVRIALPVRENQLQVQLVSEVLPFLRRRVAVPVPQILLLADGNVRLDRIHCGHRRNGWAGRAHQRPDLLLGDARDAVNRRDEAGESQVDPRRFYLSFG